MSQSATDRKQGDLGRSSNKGATLRVNLRSLNLRDDIFQMRYGSPRTGLNNFANKKNEFMKVISINLAQKNLRNSIASGRPLISTSPGHLVEKGTCNIRLTTKPAAFEGGRDGTTRNYAKQTFRTACGGSTLDGLDGRANNQKQGKPSKNRKIQSTDLTALLQEQPTSTLMPHKKFQAITLRHFNAPNPVSVGSPSSAQGPNGTHYSIQTQQYQTSTTHPNRPNDDTTNGSKFNWLNTSKYLQPAHKTDCFIPLNPSSRFNKNHTALTQNPKRHKQDSLNSSALANHSIISSRYSKNSKVVEEDSRVETPAVNMQARLSHKGSIFDQKKQVGSQHSVEEGDYVDEQEQKQAFYRQRAAGDNTNTRSKVIVSKKTQKHSAQANQEKREENQQMKNNENKNCLESNFSQELKKYEGYSDWQIKEEKTEYRSVSMSANNNPSSAGDKLEQMDEQIDNKFDQSLRKKKPPQRQNEAENKQDAKVLSNGEPKKGKIEAKDSMDMGDELGMVEMADEPESPLSGGRVKSPFQSPDPLKDTLEISSAVKLHRQSPDYRVVHLQKSVQSEQSEASNTKMINVTHSSQFVGENLSGNAAGYNIDMSRVNQVNVFDQGRISYINDKMARSPRLEDNLQIKSIKVPKRKNDEGVGESPVAKDQQNSASFPNADGSYDHNQRAKSLATEENSIISSRAPRSPKVARGQAPSRSRATKNDQTQQVSHKSIELLGRENLQTPPEREKKISDRGDTVSKEGETSKPNQDNKNEISKELFMDKENTSEQDDVLDMGLKFSKIQVQQDQNNINKVYIVQTKSVRDNSYDEGNSGKRITDRINSDLITTFKDGDGELCEEEQGPHPQQMQTQGTQPQANQLEIKEQTYIQPRRAGIVAASNLGCYGDARVAQALPSQRQNNSSKHNIYYQNFKVEQSFLNIDQDQGAGAPPMATDLHLGLADGEQNITNHPSNRDSIFMQNSIFQNEKSYPELEKKNLQVDQIISSKSKGKRLQSINWGMLTDPHGPGIDVCGRRISFQRSTARSKRTGNRHGVMSRGQPPKVGNGQRITESLIAHSIDLKLQIQRAMRNIAQTQDREGIFGQKIEISSQLSRYHQALAEGRFSLAKHMQLLDDSQSAGRRAHSSHLGVNPTSLKRNNKIPYAKSRQTPCKCVVKGEQSLAVSIHQDDDSLSNQQIENPINLITLPVNVGNLHTQDHCRIPSPPDYKSPAKRPKKTRLESPGVQEVKLIQTNLKNEKRGNNVQQDTLPNSSTNLNIPQNAPDKNDHQGELGSQVGNSPSDEKNRSRAKSIELKSWTSSNNIQHGQHPSRNAKNLPQTSSRDATNTQPLSDNHLKPVGYGMDPADKSAISSNQLLHSLKADQQRIIGKLYAEGHAFPNLHSGPAAADPHFASISSRRDQSIDFNRSQESQRPQLRNVYPNDSIILQENQAQVKNLSILDNSLNQSLAQTLIVEHAKNQGKPSPEKAPSFQMGAGRKRGPKIETQFSTINKPDAPSIPSSPPLLPYSLPQSVKHRGQQPTKKNQFISSKQRQEMKELQRSMHIPSARNDIYSEISKITNAELIEAQIKLMPNFGLFKNSHIDSERGKIERKEIIRNGSAQRSPIEKHLNQINQQIFSYRGKDGLVSPLQDPSKERQGFDKKANRKSNAAQNTKESNTPGGYGGLGQSKQIELNMNSGEQSLTAPLDRASTDRHPHERRKSDESQNAGPDQEKNQEPETATSLLRKPNQAQLAKQDEEMQPRERNESQRTVQTIESQENQEVSEQPTTPLLQPKQDLGKSPRSPKSPDKLKLSRRQMDQVVGNASKSHENEKSETNRSNVLSKYPPAGNRKNRELLTDIEEAKREQSIADMIKTAEASCGTALSREDLDGLRLGGFGGIDDIHGEIRNILVQQHGDENDKFRLNLQQIKDNDELTPFQKHIIEKIKTQSVHHLLQSSFDRQMVQQLLKYQEDIHQFNKARTQKRSANSTRLSTENQDIINKFYKYKQINDLFKTISAQNQKLRSPASSEEREPWATDRAHERRVLSQQGRQDEPEFRMSLNEPWSVDQAALNNTLGPLNVDINTRQSSGGNMRYQAPSSSGEYSQSKALRDVAHRQNLEIRRRRSVLYDDQQSYHATSMRQALIKSQYESMEYKRESSQSVIDEYDKIQSQIDSTNEQQVKGQESHPKTRKSVRFKEGPDNLLGQPEMAARSRSQLQSEDKQTPRVFRKRPAPEQNFKNYCRSLEQQAKVDHSYHTIENVQTRPAPIISHWLTMNPILFRNNFKNFKCYLPGEGSQKHGEIRKTDSREIIGIVQNRVDQNRGTDPRSHDGTFSPRKRKQPHREGSLASPRKADLEHRTLRVKLAHAAGQSSVVASLCCDLPQISVHNEFGENLTHPYFNHRVTQDEVVQKCRAQYLKDQQLKGSGGKRRLSTTGRTSQLTDKSSRPKTPASE